MKSHRGFFALSLTALVALAIIGCAADPHARWKGLGAVYASQIPIYPGAVYEDAMGGDYYGEDMNHISETMSWYFNVQDDPEKVVAYYEKRYPNAEKKIEEDGEVVLRFAPDGAQPGETIWLRVAKGKLKIGEETMPGKHKEV